MKNDNFIKIKKLGKEKGAYNISLTNNVALEKVGEASPYMYIIILCIIGSKFIHFNNIEVLLNIPDC